MLLMITVICIIKYSGLGAEIIKGYNMWSLLTTFIPLIFLAILMGVRKIREYCFDDELDEDGRDNLRR